MPPTVSIDQRSGSANPRSTVATVTEIHDYLRLLYARAGIPHCPTCGRPIRRQTPEQMVAGVLAMQEGRKVLIARPAGPRPEGAAPRRLPGRSDARGCSASGSTGRSIELKDDPKLAKTKPHDIEAVVDRLVVREGIRPRLAESIDLALKLGEGTVLLRRRRKRAGTTACSASTSPAPTAGPASRSWSPAPSASTAPTAPARPATASARSPPSTPTWSSPTAPVARRGGGRPLDGPGATARRAPGDDREAGRDFLKRHRLSRDRPLASWPAKASQSVPRRRADGSPACSSCSSADDAAAKTERAAQRSRPSASDSTCPACLGARLRPGSPRGHGRRPGDPRGRWRCRSSRPGAFFDGLTFEPPLDLVGPPLVREIARRLEFLDRVGLGYLTLARGADTLSGGELQRVRLATQIGSGLVGVCYVLDEPTAGLHPRDTDRLLASLPSLRDQGNSVVVVEHDEATIRAADWLIDLGPGAGPDGGRVVADGPPGVLERVRRVAHRPLPRHEAGSRPRTPTAWRGQPRLDRGRRRLGAEPQGDRRADSRSAP